MNTEKQKVGSVLVIGGGIAGMQVSLDLTDAGFKVYLVEDSPAIGGKMSQLDKTFPTNDCSMCIMAPRLVDVAGNLNIDLLTLSEISKVEGSAGRFAVEVRKRPRYVNEEKCTGCGTCSTNCLVQNKPYFGRKSSEVLLSTEDTVRVKALLDNYSSQPEFLLAILQDVQVEYNYLPQDILRFIAQSLEIPLSRVYGLATYYTALSLKPKGKYIISVCLGTACHVKGAEGIVERLQRDLDISCGETTSDLSFTLEEVRCLGCCSLAPVMTINGKAYGHLTPDKASRIIEGCYENKNNR